ncbi:hypothetical protein MMC06_004142 [Schaereria dolodes]|nr:hypothetical protein [Schaereria dolodes]
MLTSHLTPALAPPAPVYADPEPKENKAKNTRRYYVEAVTNHKFAVNVTLTSTFLMGNCDGVKISMKFDGGTEWHHFISRLQHVSGPHLAVATFTFFPEYDENLKQWTRGEFSFGRLDTLESNHTIHSLADVQELGMIQVTCERVFRRKRPIPYFPALQNHKTITEVSEKMLKGKAIANTVRTGVVPQPETKYEYMPVAAPAGDPVYFQLLYRSRYALQMIGCIPQNSSPRRGVANTNISRTNNVATSGPGELPMNLEQEVHTLRARLALLERNTNIKPEPYSGDRPLLTNILSTSSAKVKREHDDAEASGPSKRQRTTGGVEVVDLTDD